VELVAQREDLALQGRPRTDFLVSTGAERASNDVVQI
jgi:hypothetical protein